MIRTAFLLGLVLLPGSSLAQQRLSTPTMPCGAAARLVSAHGAIVLGTGGHTYDRYVRDVGFCQRDETTEPAWAPAADTPQCFVGYRCKSRNIERGDGGGRD
jgi:hypothetical protein